MRLPIKLRLLQSLELQRRCGPNSGPHLLDAKSQTPTLPHHTLGHMTQRIEPNMTSSWAYDSAASGIGKLAPTSIMAGQGAA